MTDGDLNRRILLNRYHISLCYFYSIQLTLYWTHQPYKVLGETVLWIQPSILYLISYNPVVPWCWEGLEAGGEGDDRGWDGWMASPTWWTWVWVNSRSWWWTGRPGVLQFMGSQRVGHDWATELNGTESSYRKLWKSVFNQMNERYDQKKNRAKSNWF